MSDWLDVAVPPGTVPREYLDLDELRRWAHTQPDARAALASVERGDWLLFLMLLSVGDEAALRKLVLAVAGCVREVLAHGPDDPRPAAALQAAEQWARGEVERAEPRTASAHAQAAAAQLLPAPQVVCHACAACARAVLARERPASWKAAIADQALRAPAQLLADAAVPTVPEGAPMAAYDERRARIAAERGAALRRFAIRLRTALADG